MESNEETVTITKAKYEELERDSLWLACLEDAGVDNWHGISFAHELMEDLDKQKSCDIIPDYINSHRGDYWYKCNNCDWTDWFARYDLPESDYIPKNCKK